MDFKISSYCETGTCVEVGLDQDVAVVRHSVLGDMVELTFSHGEWLAFIRGVKAGEFDLPAAG